VAEHEGSNATTAPPTLALKSERELNRNNTASLSKKEQTDFKVKEHGANSNIAVSEGGCELKDAEASSGTVTIEIEDEFSNYEVIPASAIPELASDVEHEVVPYDALLNVESHDQVTEDDVPAHAAINSRDKVVDISQVEHEHDGHDTATPHDTDPL
jgi:hypothetical protein